MIYIVLPIYNEEKNIAAIIHEIRKIMKYQSYRVVAVNDGSTDTTLKILKKLEGKNLHVLSHTLNMNIGSAFMTGIAFVLGKAKAKDVMVIMESDSTSSIELLPRMINQVLFGEYDIVIASRYIKGGGYKHFPIIRYFISQIANWVMRIYFPINRIRDYTIFYRAYRVGVLQKAIEIFGVPGLIQSIGFVANAELLVKLSWVTSKIAEVPFLYDYGKKRGSSKIGMMRTMNEYLVVISYLRTLEERVRKRDTK